MWKQFYSAVHKFILYVVRCGRFGELVFSRPRDQSDQYIDPYPEILILLLQYSLISTLTSFLGKITSHFIISPSTRDSGNDFQLLVFSRFFYIRFSEKNVWIFRVDFSKLFWKLCFMPCAPQEKMNETAPIQNNIAFNFKFYFFRGHFINDQQAHDVLRMWMATTVRSTHHTER